MIGLAWLTGGGRQARSIGLLRNNVNGTIPKFGRSFVAWEFAPDGASILRLANHASSLSVNPIATVGFPTAGGHDHD